jgi:hypothetical protein
MNYTKTGKAFDIVSFCQSKKNQRLYAINYTKVATAGNDPKITNAMRYSQYVKSTKPHKPTYEYFDHTGEAIIFIETYAANLNIDLSNYDYKTQTTDFLDGKQTSSYVYLEFLKAIFGTHISEMLVGLYPIMPLSKATYLKRQADIVSAKGNIMPHFRNYSFIFPR